MQRQRLIVRRRPLRTWVIGTAGATTCEVCYRRGVSRAAGMALRRSRMMARLFSGPTQEGLNHCRLHLCSSRQSMQLSAQLQELRQANSCQRLRQAQIQLILRDPALPCSGLRCCRHDVYPTLSRLYPHHLPVVAACQPVQALLLRPSPYRGICLRCLCSTLRLPRRSSQRIQQPGGLQSTGGQTFRLACLTVGARCQSCLPQRGYQP